MRAHSIRRTLWLTNVLLGAAVIGLVAWVFLDVLPAAADPARRKADFAAKEFEEYKARPNAAPSVNAPVSADDIATIDRPEYRKLNYWIFSGPMPPEPKPETDKPVEAAKPTGLETLGKAAYVIYMEPDPTERVASESVVAWRFPDKKLGNFKPGQFIHQQGQAPRFKLTDVKRPDPEVSVYELLYDVYDDPNGAPVKSGLVFRHDAEQKVDTKGPVRDVPLPGEAPAAGPATGPTEKPVAGVTRAGGTPPAPFAPEPPRPAPRFEEIAPKVERIGADRVDVEFDQNTYDYVRGKSVESLAETVKTQPAVDRRTGQSLGLRITGFSGDSPADRFDVKPNDILVSVNDVRIPNRETLVRIIQAMPPDTSRVKVVIDRLGKLITYNIDPRDPKTRRAARYLEPNLQPPPGR